MKKLSVYYTPSHASVTVQNGAARETSANDMPAVLAAMHPQDLMALYTFAQAICAWVESNGADTTQFAQLAEQVRG